MKLNKKASSEIDWTILDLLKWLMIAVLIFLMIAMIKKFLFEEIDLSSILRLK